MKRKSLTVEKVIEEGEFHLRKYLSDYGNVYPRIGVPFNNRELKFIDENMADIQALGKQRNLYVFRNEKHTEYIYFEYICKAKVQRKYI